MDISAQSTALSRVEEVLLAITSARTRSQMKLIAETVALATAAAAGETGRAGAPPRLAGARRARDHDIVTTTNSYKEYPPTHLAVCNDPLPLGDMKMTTRLV